MKITAAARPFTLIFMSGNAHPLTSEEAQRLLDEYPATSVSANRVVLPEHENPRRHVTLVPATRGGGPAFTFEENK